MRLAQRVGEQCDADPSAMTCALRLRLHSLLLLALCCLMFRHYAHVSSTVGLPSSPHPHPRRDVGAHRAAKRRRNPSPAGRTCTPSEPRQGAAGYETQTGRSRRYRAADTTQAPARLAWWDSSRIRCASKGNGRAHTCIACPACEREGRTYSACHHCAWASTGAGRGTWGEPVRCAWPRAVVVRRLERHRGRGRARSVGCIQPGTASGECTCPTRSATRHSHGGGDAVRH